MSNRSPTQQLPPARGWHRLHSVLAVCAVVGLVVDQVTKAVAVQALSDGSVVPLLDGWLGLRLLRNPGAAFSMGEGATWLFTVAAVVVIGVILRTSRRLGSLAWAVVLGMLLAGAVGNLIDRLLRQPGFGRGHVVDFIGYGDWFVGNVADILIVLAAAGVGVLGLRGISPDGSRARDGAGAGAGDGRAEAPPGETPSGSADAPAARDV